VLKGQGGTVHDYCPSRDVFQSSNICTVLLIAAIYGVVLPFLTPFALRGLGTFPWLTSLKNMV
jgi:hypothetical protein